MSIENQVPSRDPADDGTMLGVLKGVLGKFLNSVDDMLPAQVISFDRATNRATVRPMIKMLTTDNQQLSRAQIASVPVLQIGGGGSLLAFNLVPGDLGWIKANDRDISLFLQTFRDNPPNTLRKHTFQDAVFIPHVMTGYSIAGEDAGNAVLQSNNGAVRVSIWPDRLKLSAGSLSVTIGPTSIDFFGPVNMPNGATIGGIPFATHKHTGVQTGGGVSGGPTS